MMQFRKLIIELMKITTPRTGILFPLDFPHSRSRVTSRPISSLHCHSKPTANTTGLDPVRTCWYFGQLSSFQQDIVKDADVPACLRNSSSRGAEILAKSFAQGAENRCQKSVPCCVVAILTSRRVSLPRRLPFFGHTLLPEIKIWTCRRVTRSTWSSTMPMVRIQKSNRLIDLSFFIASPYAPTHRNQFLYAVHAAASTVNW
jgi:hypothetical protein